MKPVLLPALYLLALSTALHAERSAVVERDFYENCDYFEKDGDIKRLTDRYSGFHKIKTGEVVVLVSIRWQGSLGIKFAKGLNIIARESRNSRTHASKIVQSRSNLPELDTLREILGSYETDTMKCINRIRSAYATDQPWIVVISRKKGVENWFYAYGQGGYDDERYNQIIKYSLGIFAKSKRRGNLRQGD